MLGLLTCARKLAVKPA